MTTLIIGDIDPQHVLEEVKKNFNTPCQKSINKERLFIYTKRICVYIYISI